MEQTPHEWRNMIQAAKENRLKSGGSTTRELEQWAMRFVEYVMVEVQGILRRP